MKPLRPPTIDQSNWNRMLQSLRRDTNVSGLTENEAKALRQAAGRHVQAIHCRAVPNGDGWKVEIPDA